MIKKIHIKNFKCFEELSLPVKTLNLYSGINGMGKSTIIQSLLLLRQTFQLEELENGLRLNGRYVQLGNAQDVLYEKAQSEWIELGYNDEETEYRFRYQYILDSDFLPLIEKKGKLLKKDIWGNCFTYLSAYRVEPQNLYGIINERELTNREFANNGEYAFQYLSKQGNIDVENEKILNSGVAEKNLANQIIAWMDKIAPGVMPQILLNLQQRNAEVRYEFREGRYKTNSYKSVNVGFGITYVLPLVIAVVSAKKGDIVMIENPEAHIHPAGQRVLGELLACAAAGGVQLFIETHSDHILNGIRLSVKEKKINHEDVQTVFFYKDDEDDFKHKYLCPQIYQDGRMDCWPDGFFDAWDKALYDLI